MGSWRLAVPLLALALGTSARGASCPGEGIVTIVANNRSADSRTSLVVSGTRVDSAGGCDPSGTGLATSYATTVDCQGDGVVACGRIAGLAPGLWVHRVSVQVSDPTSAVQLQAQRSLVVAGPATSNVVEWTVFAKTFLVTQATRADARAQLDAARAYTNGGSGPALVRFSRSTFPGAGTPTTIAMQSTPSCALDTCSDGRQTAYCFEGSNVTIDALDDDALPGAVVLSVSGCHNSLVRLYGNGDVLRGLVLQGSVKQPPGVAVDTVAIAGLATGGIRLERSIVDGPGIGDAVSVEGDASHPGSGTAPENSIVDSEILGAEDKGIKVDFGGTARVERSCIHDNANGGIQATLGGTVTAIENVVQHNVGGSAQNGLFVGVPEDATYPNALATSGNVIRFNGARGISVVNDATATLADDVVTDNYRAGLRIVAALPEVVPTATARGGLFACNFAPGTCLSDSAHACRADSECSLQVCGASGAVTGVGAALNAPCADPGCETPVVDLGLGGNDAGRNAFTLNANPTPPASGSPGVNVSSAITPPSDVPAAGNQWEHCDLPVDPVNPNKCNVAAVAASDVRVDPGATPLALGTPTGPRHGPAPIVARISPGRPHAGELVRVYASADGGTFDAIDGAACAPAGLPLDACSAENTAVVARNAGDPSQGNHVTVTLDGVDYPADVHQVTPEMLVFAMPVDCWVPGTLTVARGNDVSLPVRLCDPDGCADREAGAPCDDHDVCTVGDACQADHTCAGAVLDCSGSCLTGACDPTTGCVPRAADVACDDGNACTVGDHCSGSDATCASGSVAPCVGTCLTGTCDPASGCTARPATAPCDDANACTTNDHCNGVDDTCVGSTIACDDGETCTADACDPVDGCTHTAYPKGTACGEADACHAPGQCAGRTCVPGAPVSCDDGRACTFEPPCDPSRGCIHEPLAGLAGVTCHVTQMRMLVGAMPPGAMRLHRTLGALLDCVAAQAAAADGATGKPHVARVRRAVGCLRRLRTRVSAARKVVEPLRGDFLRETDDARAALDAYFSR